MASIIREGEWHWLVDNSPDIITVLNTIPSSMVPYPSRRDEIRWLPSPTGLFSTSSAWVAIRAIKSQVSWFGLI